MPSAANGEVDKLVPMYNAENSPIRRMVEVLQAKIASLEKQRNKLTTGSKGGKDAAASGEPKVNSGKVDELNQMLEVVWDLCKQAMGIAILSENEAKKQARKESAVRKGQDTQLVRDVLLILDCLEQLNDPVARQDFLAGTGGASQLSEGDLRILDDIYPEVTPKHCPEEGEVSFDDQAMNAAKHLIAIVDGSPGEIVGSTYAHIKSVVDTVYESGYLDLSKDAIAEVVVVDELEMAVAEAEQSPEETDYNNPPSQPAPPPPAPQAVPTPTFPLLPPNAPPVTLQQVEHAYFAQQYGHQQKPPIPEVFSPLNFIFLQESEIDTPEATPQPPSPKPVTPNSIPTQTFTNQNFSIPGQHMSAPDQHMPPLPPGAQHYTPEVPPTHLAAYPSGNAPQPMAMPMNMPPYQQNMPYKMAQHPHPHPMERVQPPTQTPPLSSEVPQHQENRIPTPPLHAQQDNDYSEWNPQPVDDKGVDKLEIDEWNTPSDHKHQHDSDGANNGDGQSGNRFRSRGRGGRGGSGGSYRGRGSYQNGGRPNGNYYRNNDNYQHRGSTNGDSNTYRDNKFENSRGSYRGGRGNSEGGRGGWRQDGGNTGAGSKTGAPRRGGPPRDRGDRQYQPRKAPNTSGPYTSDNKQYSQ